MTRLTLAAAALSAAVLALSPTVTLAAPAAAPATAAQPDMALGNVHAKITVIEYASTTCSHCAAWNAEVFPDFKKKYIDTGKVRYILRELPTQPGPLSAAGFLVARCAGPDKYFSVVDDLWRSQDQLFKTQDGRAWLVAAGAKVGLPADKVEACATDQAAGDLLFKRAGASAAAMKVTGTPAVFVNNKLIGEGEIPLAKIDAAIQAADAAHPAKPHKGH
jgi:protein-disulfide isomerase